MRSLPSEVEKFDRLASTAFPMIGMTVDLKIILPSLTKRYTHQFASGLQGSALPAGAVQPCEIGVLKNLWVMAHTHGF
jgi:hypothetical protein